MKLNSRNGKKRGSKPSKSANNNNKQKSGGNAPLQSLASKVDRVLKLIPRGTFSAAGGMIGGPIGAAIGGGISTITGYGDYYVKSNTIASYGKALEASTEVPSFSGDDRNVRIRHRECIGTIASPATPALFTNKTYRVNPGNNLTFPWLAGIAANYQQYKFHGLVFFFKSETSEYSATTAMGKVILATNYNVLDPAYSSAIEMQNSQFAVADKPSRSIMHALECDPGQSAYKLYYTADANSGVTPTNDFANFQIATDALVAASTAGLGTLWVTYDVELMKPIIPFGALTNTASMGELWTAQNTAAFNRPITAGTFNAVVSQTTARPLGIVTGVTPVSTDTWAKITLNTSGSGNDILFPKAGLYKLDMYIEGTGFTNGTSGFAITTTAGATSPWKAGSAVYDWDSTTAITFSAMIWTLSANTSVTIGWISPPASVTSSLIMFASVNPGL